MRDEDVIDMQEAEERHEAMDYAQHEGTWERFISLTKWAIIHLAFIVVALYCILAGGVPWFGLLLLVIALFLVPGWYLFGRRA